MHALLPLALCVLSQVSEPEQSKGVIEIIDKSRSFINVRDETGKCPLFYITNTSKLTKEITNTTGSAPCKLADLRIGEIGDRGNREWH